MKRVSLSRPLIFLAFLAACTGKGDGTVSLPSRPVEGPKATELPPVPLNPNSPVEVGHAGAHGVQ